MATRNRNPRRAYSVADQGNVITRERAAEMDRGRERLMRGRTFADNSADLIREARAERTSQD